MAELRDRLGVVAIGRNEGERLIRCLRSLAREQVRAVYVDSASTDGSAQAAAALGAEVLALDLARPFTAARARAEGFARLESIVPELEYVFFIDGDCEVEQGWIAQALTFLDNTGDFAAVCGRRRERFPEQSPYNALADSEWNTPVGEAKACGGDAVFRVSAYRAVGGFDPAMIAGEEPELCSRLRKAGGKIMRLDAAMTIHDAAIHHFGQWWKRAIRSGFGYAQAWWTTGVLYRRELARAVVWAGILPLAAVVMALTIKPWLILLWPGATVAQFLRLSRREGWLRAWLAMVGKYAEILGAVRFALRALRGQTGGTVNYK
jgi:GT2 family glycosyltransferase